MHIKSKKLKIAVNTRLLIKSKLEGIGWFTFETLKRICIQHPEHEFYFIFDRKFDESFVFSDNVIPIVISPQARHPFLYYIWFEYSVKRVLKKIKPDLFLSPDGYLSLSSKIPSLVVMHDLNFEHYPQDLPFLERKYYRHFFPLYAKKADRIATVSEFSRKDIVEQYNIQPEKIDVVYNGVNESYCPLEERTKIETITKYTQGAEYFVYVGALNPRKNLVNLFKAFDLYKNKYVSNTKLVIVGVKMYWTPAIKESYEQMTNKLDVIFTGRLAVDELHKVLASALAMTYVSYFEGFGIPIVEAFSCGVPVISSNISSLPEIAGDAALKIDPFSPEEISEAMNLISSNENLRKTLIEKGLKRSEMFSWQKSADRLWESICKVLT